MTMLAEEVIKVIQERPDVREQVRRAILTDELLELPQALERFIEATDRRFEESEAAQARLEESQARLEAGQASLEAALERFMESTERRLAESEAAQARLEASQASLEAVLQRFMESTERRLEALESGQLELKAVLRQFMESTDRHFKSLDNDVGDIKGFHAREVFARSASILLPMRMGFDLKSRLSEDDIAAILRGADTAGIDEDDLISFVEADAYLLVEDAEGAERYVVVEVSYTVHTNDVERADRNAQLLSRWTGLPADSAVAGVNLHDAAYKFSQDTGTTFLRIRSNALRAR